MRSLVDPYLSNHTNAKYLFFFFFCKYCVTLGHHNGSKKRDNKTENNSRKRFCESLEALFDLAAKNAEQQLSGDRPRTEKAKHGDVGFLHDQRNARKTQMSNLEYESTEKWQRKCQRVETENLKITQAFSS